MTSTTRRTLDAEALLAAYRDGVRSFRQVVITGRLVAADLEGVDFSEARLHNVRFEGGQLSTINFERAVLSNVTFCQVTLTGVTFAQAYCHAVQFQQSAIAQSNFNQLEADQTDVRFLDVTLENCNFSQSKLTKIDFSRCGRLRGLDFTQAQLRGLTFRGKALQECTFLQAHLSGVDFRETTLTKTTFESAVFNTLPSRAKGLLWALPAIALATPPMILIYRTFFWGWTANLPSFWLGIGGMVLAAIPLLLAFAQQETSFRRANVGATRFTTAKLFSVNFCDANCTQADFQQAATGVASKSGRGLVLVYTSLLITVITMVVVGYLGGAFWGILETFKTSDIGPNHSKFLAYIALVVVGFSYFLVTSLLRHLDAAIWSLPVTAIAIFAVNLQQPILNGLVWILAFYALFEIFKLLIKLNVWLTLFVATALIALSVSAVFQYDRITSENLTTLRAIPIVLMVTVFTALRTGAAIAEVGFFTGWPFGLVFAISVLLPVMVGALFFILGGASLAVYVGGNPNTELGSILFALLLAIAIFVGVILGAYFGWQALRDRPEYRLLRDRGVFLSHWFGSFGTQFKSARLVEADFAFAILKNADFFEAQLDRVTWYGATHLAGDRFGRSYLRYPVVRTLVARRQGLFIPQSKRAKRFVRSLQQWPRSLQGFLHPIIASPPTTQFAYLDLRKIRLSGWAIAAPRSPFPRYNLSQLNFQGANLQGADLRGVDLHGTNFSEAHLAGADLRHTELTNVGIRNWQVDASTQFDGAHCQQVYLDHGDPSSDSPIAIALEANQNALDHQVFRNLLLQAEDVEEIANLEQEFAKIDSIQNSIHREYKLNQLANQAPQKYGIESDRYRQMFDYHLRAKRQANRKKTWWQSFLWFKIEPRIERFNQLTQELDIFPLLENLGRLSILVAVITFVNSALKPPDLNLEQYYRSWEIIHSDTEQVRGARRFALEQLRTAEGSLVGISASAQNLRGINLRGANLTRADLSNSDLSEAVLSGAILEEANLSNAILQETQFGYRQHARRASANPNELFKPSFLRQSTNLNRADLTRADLTNANLVGVDLNNAELTAAVLANSDLTRADIEQSNLSGANLKGAKLVQTDLVESNLQRANLTAATFDKAELQRSRLLAANLSNTKIRDTNFTQADLQRANLQQAIITGANFQRSNLRGANLQGATISATNFAEALYDNETVITSDAVTMALAQAYPLRSQADLSGANLANQDLSGVDLSRAILANANLRAANLTAAVLQQADLSAAVLTDAQAETADWHQAVLTGADLQGSTLTDANLRAIDAPEAVFTNATMMNTNLEAANLVDTDFRNVNLTNANLENANLTNANLTGANWTNAKIRDAIYCNTTLPNEQVLNRDCAASPT
jgi:uncharacterized protein YjbI with pentapeptide repeats